MKTLLLLSSSRFLNNNLAPDIGRSWDGLRIANIINASKGKGVVDLSYLKRSKEAFKKHNCYFEDLDLDGKSEEDLRKILKNFNTVFVNGGSTFYLLKSIRESGFDKVIKELLPKGFIYMGGSAGAYVACPSIEMALWGHQDKYDHCGLKDFTGLGLVPFLISVHYLPEYQDFLKEKIRMAKYPVKILSDSQALLIKNDKVVLLGGEEIKL